MVDPSAIDDGYDPTPLKGSTPDWIQNPKPTHRGRPTFETRVIPVVGLRTLGTGTGSHLREGGGKEDIVTDGPDPP